ncbi:ABC1 family protein MCP2 {ECO:0000305/PubMed:23781023} AltName: Full=MDM10-complementing protein 2 {ECO:0000303/PubMed:23781023}; AltName: Full=MIOREX complex component 13 {ECO:0000305/PubMed:25683707}; AltName: Full=Mitochondrial organization of gene expression protein 13 {ECO:0000303/PubMed:25683707}; Flags: Precursor [Serendipita indica DSM 11827]|nr:ABC1 family protein MCP2 {ECO:0000305/PubMed:23781023} AltName: Full=MDM10-complementing protein 2 {ECO:0000303/PubMed:23781023}; AltName: Full=MIOREX complex component 13 {ECO:0000305/PubMed:25683707}; AltName: Full=Mitochondrial organization of gene expression protein 13 {ECO:0000303/PubMed:25683707}; Flags: Precursor [Serendipita indica DSM 11827]
MSDCIQYQIIYNYDDIRFFSIAVVRTTRIATAATLAVLDYRRTYAAEYPNEEERLAAISACHTRAATHTLHALLANSGVYVKLGQHISSSIILPIEWQTTMRPCLDSCEVSTFEEIKQVFFEDNGMTIESVFSDFDPVPLGVASLAQVHSAVLRGQKVAVKIQHPGLQEFAAVDLVSTDITLRIIKWLFPDFEFSWLGREMAENLPREMNFLEESANAARVAYNFERTAPDSPLYIPKVFSATKRTLVMEFIEGHKIDDGINEFLATHGIDRNRVSQELAKIFSEQVYIHGWFHADPHKGNLLIRPSWRNRHTNFDIVLLDHGLYFDIPDELRINYARFWLSLLSPATEKNREKRQKYATLVGNIKPERYNVFEAALTGRPSGSWGGKKQAAGRLQAIQQAAAMFDMGNLQDQEMEKLRTMLVANGGIMVAMFEILRGVDSKVLMLFKLNELTRSLDHALHTTHPPFRVFLIVGQYCNRAVWQDEKQSIVHLEHGRVQMFFKRWFVYQFRRLGFSTAAFWMDLRSSLVLTSAWLRGLFLHGFDVPHLTSAPSIMTQSYIIVFKDHASAEEIESAKKRIQESGESGSGGEVVHDYGTVLRGFSAKVTPEFINTLQSNFASAIDYIEEDQVVTTQ